MLDMEPPDFEEYFYSEDYFTQDRRLDEEGQSDSSFCDEYDIDI